jgi:uncharacterized membrane protein YozB (DUF420 family)
MTTQRTHIEKASGSSAGLLLGLTGALSALLILNLAVFDDLRTDPTAGVLETFVKPQHLSSLVAVLIAATLIAFKHRSAARVAVLVAWIEIAAFSFFHLIPLEIGPSKPYWGDGMGDALQWVGVLSIIVVSAAIVRVGREAVTPAAASLQS